MKRREPATRKAPGPETCKASGARDACSVGSPGRAAQRWRFEGSAGVGGARVRRRQAFWELVLRGWL
jgi:hypothetical protein